MNEKNKPLFYSLGNTGRKYPLTPSIFSPKLMNFLCRLYKYEKGTIFSFVFECFVGYITAYQRL
jgi:hypothetical protein